jgi:hypothetical protein
LKDFDMTTSVKTSKLKSLDAVYTSIEQAMAAIVAEIEASRDRPTAVRPRPRRTARRTAHAA